MGNNMPGKNKKLRVPYALSVYDEKEENAVLNTLKQHKSILGKKTMKFESYVSKLFGKKYGIMVNSGSSANLLAVELLNLKKESKVITPVLTFSTTIAPLIQKGLTPVFVDVEKGTYLANIDEIRDNISNKVKALMIPSLLGNIPDVKILNTISKENSLYFIEDSCDTLGATISGVPTGKYSDISTTSFYGSHIITAAGGGGMLCVNHEKWDRRARILRGWGRLSAINESENIDSRFGVKIDGIPYDSKFVFEEIGYNFLPLEISSAFGLEQLKKLSKFIKIRNSNFFMLYKYFSGYKEFFVLPKQLKEVQTSWLGFPLTITSDAPFSRTQLLKYMENNNIQTRPIFTGNILRQPGFKGIIGQNLKKDYPVTDEIMKNGFILGCNHGLEKKHIDYMIKSLSSFLDKFH